MNRFKEDAKYLFYVLVHPFDGFYEVRFRGKANYLIASLIVILYGISKVMAFQYTGFVLNTNDIDTMNSVKIFINSLFPMLLFIVSNWSITTLFDGSGRMQDIFVIMAYSLAPKVFLDIIQMVLSNCIIIEEAPLLLSVGTIGTIWFLFLAFCGLCVIHEYAPGKNVLTVIATAGSAIIVVFLGMLYFTLIGKFFGTIAAIISELMKRW